MEARPARGRSIDELLHGEHYSAEELAELLEIDVEVIRHAARDGTLRAYVVDHHILDIYRSDVLRWLMEWERP